MTRYTYYQNYNFEGCVSANFPLYLYFEWFRYSTRERATFYTLPIYLRFHFFLLDLSCVRFGLVCEHTSKLNQKNI